MPGCSPEQLNDAAAVLGFPFPEWLRSVYQRENGRWSDAGQWWVIWPLDELISRTVEAHSAGLLDASLVAFGDDGTGDPFCVSESESAVWRWSVIDGEVVEEMTTDAFLATWVPRTQ